MTTKLRLRSTLGSDDTVANVPRHVRAIKPVRLTSGTNQLSNDKWSALLSGAASFRGASVGRLCTPTATGWRCLDSFNQAPMRPKSLGHHDREARQEKSEKLCVPLRPLRLRGAFFFFGCGLTAALGPLRYP